MRLLWSKNGHNHPVLLMISFLLHNCIESTLQSILCTVLLTSQYKLLGGLNLLLPVYCRITLVAYDSMDHCTER